MVNLQFYLCSGMLLKLNWSLLTFFLCSYISFYLFEHNLYIGDVKVSPEGKCLE